MPLASGDFAVSKLHGPLTLCIINYNGADYLMTALEAVAGFTGYFDEVLIIDNASTDNSVEIARGFPFVSVVSLASNGGPGAARNAGFRLARNDLILFQDNDVQLNVDAVRNLTQAMSENANAVIAAPRVLYASAPDTIQYESADCHFTGMMSVRFANIAVAEVPASTASTSSLVTACFMLHRGRWRGGLPFDERLVFNLEDHDFGVRANILGHTVLAVGSAVVSHGGGTADLSWRPGYRIPDRRMFCLIRNRWWIMLKYFSGPTLLKLAPVLLVIELLQFAGMIQKGFGRQWIAAFWSTLANFPSLLVQRQYWQNHRQKRDQDILKPGPLPLTSAIKTNQLIADMVGRVEMLMQWYVSKVYFS
ncbi:glycosyltransferase family 2 protein [Allohahella marinimesophila]|uniref:Glycosyltransferase family 2 protein n=1 Tax=Allohahella marinimesophila TaxID=1054972 RepID=A0ABP7PXS1_9GAMM